jgi:hypothetical protein
MLTKKALHRRPSNTLRHLLVSRLRAAGTTLLRRHVRRRIARAQHPARDINDLTQLEAVVTLVRTRLPEAVRHGEILAIAAFAQVVALDP